MLLEAGRMAPTKQDLIYLLVVSVLCGNGFEKDNQQYPCGDFYDIAQTFNPHGFLLDTKNFQCASISKSNWNQAPRGVRFKKSQI